MAKITQYPAKTVPSNNDEFVLHDPAAGSTKKMTRGDLIGGAPLPADSVTTAAIADESITADKVDFSTFPILFGGNTSLSSTTTKTLTPALDGVLYVTAHSRRNSGTGGDNQITITVAGATDGITGTAVGNGTTDGFAKADYIGAVSANTSITITITASNISNGSWKFFVIPGSPQLT